MQNELVESDSHRRLRCYTIDRWTLARLVMEGMRISVIEGAPPDARLLGMTWDEASASLLITVQHDSFDYVPEGSSAAGWFGRIRVETPANGRIQRAYTLRDIAEMTSPHVER